MATASAAAAPASAGRLRPGLSGGSAIPVRRAEYRKLNGILSSRTPGAGDFLRLTQNDELKLRIAFLADVFVNGHDRFIPESFTSRD